MNTSHSSISEVSPGGLIGASERQHYAAPSGHPMWVPRRAKYQTQSPLQKLLSMVEPIISPLSYEHSEDDVSQCTVNIEDIVSTPRLHNSFILYLTHTQQTARLRDFYFAIRCKEFKEWGDKVQYGPYRKQFLAKNIYQTFVKENGSNALTLSENVRRRVDRAMSECKLVPNMFDEVYRASLATLQQTVVKKFVESNYYQTIYNEMNCDLRSLTIGGGNIRNKKASSLGSSGSSLSSSSSRPRHGLMGKFMSSCDSFSSGSEFQSLQSFSTNSSTSSTGSTYASTAHCKYYKVRNKTNTPPNNKEKNEKRTEELLKELLPKLNVIANAQNERIEIHGDMFEGPDGADTPTVLRKPTTPQQGLSVTSIEHGSISSHERQRVLPLTLEHERQRVVPLTLEAAFKGPLCQSSEPLCVQSQPLCQQSLCQQSEPMVCEERVQAWTCDPEKEPTQRSIPIQYEGSNSSYYEESVSRGEIPMEHSPKQDTPMDTTKSKSPAVCVAYTFNNDTMVYSKTLPGPSLTLGQFKEIIAWHNKQRNLRFLFKKKLEGIGEVNEDITEDTAYLPFWSGSTIVARIEEFGD